MGGLFLLLTFTNEKVNQALRHIINLGQIQKVIQDISHKALPAPTKTTEKGAFSLQIKPGGTSLVIQWLRSHLLIHGTQVQSLV